MSIFLRLEESCALRYKLYLAHIGLPFFHQDMCCMSELVTKHPLEGRG